MSLEQTLKNATGHIRDGLLENEAQVKQAVILPILRALGWNDGDPESFRPEYSVDNGSVDYALLDRDRPLVFIEAKRIGAMDDGGEEQLFGYASNRGVPLLVLTDGGRWDFYLSMAAGAPGERRFYRLELSQLEERNREYIDFLGKHLQRDRVVSGDARRSAEELHESNQERERAYGAIPDVWRTLLQGPDNLLRDLLVEEVESECGTRPELDDVEAFLRSLLFPDAAGPPRPERARITGFALGEERVEARTAIDTLVKLLTRLGRDDSGFMERFASKTVFRTRKLVARDRNDLYKKSDMIRYSVELENGWWLGTNLSASRIRAHIQTACGVAEIEFGSQLTLLEC